MRRAIGTRAVSTCTCKITRWMCGPVTTRASTGFFTTLFKAFINGFRYMHCDATFAPMLVRKEALPKFLQFSVPPFSHQSKLFTFSGWFQVLIINHNSRMITFFKQISDTVFNVSSKCIELSRRHRVH